MTTRRDVVLVLVVAFLLAAGCEGVEQAVLFPVGLAAVPALLTASGEGGDGGVPIQASPSVTPTPTPTPTPGPTPTPTSSFETMQGRTRTLYIACPAQSGQSVNCADFFCRQQAQTYFDKLKALAGKDCQGLDADDPPDQVACERVPDELKAQGVTKEQWDAPCP